MTLPMSLVHYAAKPVTAVRSVSQRAQADMKPLGIWISDDACEDNWRFWCEAERFQLDRLSCAHDVVLHPRANILHLDSADGIDRLTNDYGFHEGRHDRYIRRIDWRAVAKKYQGIIITPYIWSRRLDGPSRWYYGWDCASGCVWNADVIASITLRDQRDASAKVAA